MFCLRVIVNMWSQRTDSFVLDLYMFVQISAT